MKRPAVEIVPSVPESATEEVAREDDRPPLGSWWWLTEKKAKDSLAEYDEPGRKWVACVIEIGSNYVKLEGVRFHVRLALDDFHKRCTREPNINAYVATKVGFHQERLRAITGEIQQLCHKLGVPFRDALPQAEEATQALATVHGTADVNKYEKALVKAKDKTLPELFKKMEEEHKAMAMWMKAELVPAMAELARDKKVTGVIQNKIHTVELYAGLQEEMVCVREGKPAKLDTKIHLMQRRHYMDEECLARYEAGGMSFHDINAFDKWLARDENFTRLLPHERCLVAFRVRHYDRPLGDDKSIEAFISLWHENRENKRTYLYIRNGRQLWRLETTIDFGAELFPKREDSDLLGDDELWVNSSYTDYNSHRLLVTGRRRHGWITNWKEERRKFARKLWAWHQAGKPEGEWFYTHEPTDEEVRYSRTVIGGARIQRTIPVGQLERPYDGRPSPGHSIHNPEHAAYELLTPHHIYFDDAMERIKRAAFEHNRIAVIVQGLIDRSTCLHPHPPWRIFTPEGFAAGIELVYDVERALTPGEEPDFDGYRTQLNKSIKVGTHTIGQYRAWKREVADKSYLKDWEFSERYGSGPDVIAEVIRMRADGSCLFRWTRSRRRAVWRPHPTKPGYQSKQWPKIEATWWCKAEHLTSITAYTPGDYRMFFDDPRTRENYLRWAPILLSAENWHARRRIQDDQKRKKKRKERPAYDDSLADEDDHSHEPGDDDDD